MPTSPATTGAARGARAAASVGTTEGDLIANAVRDVLALIANDLPPAPLPRLEDLKPEPLFGRHRAGRPAGSRNRGMGDHGAFSFAQLKPKCQCQPCKDVRRLLGRVGSYDEDAGGLIAAACWCGLDFVVTTDRAVFAGTTASCGRPGCEPSAVEVAS